MVQRTSLFLWLDAQAEVAATRKIDIKGLEKGCAGSVERRVSL
jgi:hypothetical protein